MLFKRTADPVLTGNASPEEVAFNRAYHLAQPAAKQRAREVGNPVLRKIALMAISSECQIDTWVDIGLESAYKENNYRVFLGIHDFPPATRDGGTPLPNIKVSANIADYPPLDPPRVFGLAEYRDVVRGLIGLGIYPANIEGRMCLLGGTDASDPETTVNSLVHWYQRTYIFAGAQCHFGIALSNGKVYDAEEISMLPDVAALQALIA